MLVQLNGTTWTNIPETQVVKSINVDALISAIMRRQAEWMFDGGLNALIPVGDMFEEFASILADLGVEDAYPRLGIAELPASYYLKEPSHA